jgi:DNA-binding response OmpR family regulator
MRVLVAEDEKKVAHFICKALLEAGYAVDVVHEGECALQLAQSHKYDVIVLDLLLPGKSGTEVLRHLRNSGNAVAVIVVTARGSLSERIEGLELGADDYLPKPFAMRELLARVAAITRRGSTEKATVVTAGDLTMNLLSHLVTRGGQEIRLAPREYAMLEFLLRHPNEVHSRATLCERVWSHHLEMGPSVVDVYIQRLRQKVDEGHSVKLLHTVWGVGFVLRCGS